MGFTNDRVALLKYQPNVTVMVPVYERYALENVMVREVFATDAEAVDTGGATVYFLDKVSVCRKEDGEAVGLPRLAKGDACILHEGTDAEVTMRVSEAGYYTGETMAHVRIKLK